MAYLQKEYFLRSFPLKITYTWKIGLYTCQESFYLKRFMYSSHTQKHVVQLGMNSFFSKMCQGHDISQHLLPMLNFLLLECLQEMLIDSNMIILFYSVMSDMDDYKYHRNKIPMFGFHEHLGRHMITIFKYQVYITIWFFMWLLTIYL